MRTDEFHFVGFLPHKSGPRRRQLEELKAVPGTIVIYESPYRIVKLLGELAEVYPTRQVALGKGTYEEIRGTNQGLPGELVKQMAARSIKGEFVVLLGLDKSLQYD